MSEVKRNKLKIPLSPDPALRPEEPVIAAKETEKPRERKAKEEKEDRQDKETSSSSPKKGKDRERVSLKMRLLRFIAFYRDGKTQQILGIVLITMAVFLALAFFSFVFTWKQDQDVIMGGAAVLLNEASKVENVLGKMGAFLSFLFMYKWFGVSSFLFVPLLLLSGLRRIIRREFPVLLHIKRFALFSVFWLSLVFAYFFSDDLLFMGGGFGYILNLKLQEYIGGVGTLVLLFGVFLGFLVIMYNFSFDRTFNSPKESDLAPAENENAVSLDQKEEESPLHHRHGAYPVDDEMTALSPEEEAALMDIKLVTKEEVKAEEKAAPVLEQPIPVQVEEMPQEMVLNEQPVKEVVKEAEKSKKEEVDFEIAPIAETPIVEPEDLAKEIVEKHGEFDPTLDLGSYQFPVLDLLENFGHIETKINQEELTGNKNKIIATLKNYGIEIDRIKATIGPTVTLYEIVPAAGVRISKIKNLEDDIALSLAALGIRIIAPIPGKGTIGIEVPNQSPDLVPMRNILASEKFQHSNFELPIALGKTISNETFIADLAKMPHLLLAGATGQGKSVGLNAILVSLLYKKHPAQIKFVLVDPKKVELTLFNKIERHFLAKLPNSEDAIITDNTKVIHTLCSLCIEMDNRYALLQDAQVRNIKEYNAKFNARRLNPNDGHKYLPYIVLVVDEFADLIMTAGKDVEMPIARLAQLARAVGIHLIIATQRPSVNIITGTIKANFPARIAFRVTSKIDSRTILDAGGAEQLIGRGDMLLSTGNDLIRIQCAFVDTPEVERITEFIGSQRGYSSAFMLPEFIDETGDGGAQDVDLSERDKMFDEAARIIVTHQQGSASLLQRKLKLGYNRAGRLVDQLEAAGIIGPFEGSKAREVLVKDQMHLEDILARLK